MCGCQSAVSQVAAELPAAVTSDSHKHARLGMDAPANLMFI